jgi:hypothetical protein
VDTAATESVQLHSRLAGCRCLVRSRAVSAHQHVWKRERLRLQEMETKVLATILEEIIKTGTLHCTMFICTASQRTLDSSINPAYMPCACHRM